MKLINLILFITIWLCIMVINLPAQEITAITSNEIMVRVSWTHPNPGDIDFYRVYWGHESRTYMNFQTTPDTFLVLFVPAERYQDTLYCSATANYLDGTETEFSDEIATVPELLQLNKDKEDRAIIIGDLRYWLALIRKWWGKDSWWTSVER